MICEVCATVLQNLVFILLLSVLGFAAEEGSGRVKAVCLCKMNSEMPNSADALSC